MIKIVVFSGNKYNLMKTIPAVVVFRPDHRQTAPSFVNTFTLSVAFHTRSCIW